MPKISDIPRVERPRERLIKKGARALREEELLAILLRTGIKGKNVIDVARDILARYTGKKLLSVGFEELRNIHGVGTTKATQIFAAIEFGSRLFDQKSDNDVYVNETEDIVKELTTIKANKKENFVALYLDARNKLIHKETVSVGILNSSLVHPREVFEPAVKNLAAQIVLGHNHPSDNPEPSEDDLSLTQKLVQAGKIMGVEVFDHIIVTDKNGHFSFKEKGLIK